MTIALLTRGYIAPLRRIANLFPVSPDAAQRLLVKSLVLPLVQESELNGIHASGIIIRTALVAAIADMRANPHLLDYVFASLPRDEISLKDYGEKSVQEAKAWFLKTDFPVSIGPPRYDMGTWPRLSIHLKDSSEVTGETTLGDNHYEPTQTNDSTWPALTGKFTPASYVPSTGTMTLSEALPIILAPGQLVVDYTGRSHEIQEVIDELTFLIPENTVADFRQSVIKPARPYLITELESSSFKESYIIGCHVAGEAAHLSWLHSIVVFCLMRYKEALLEARGFERSTPSSSDFAPQGIGNDDVVLSRFLVLSGFVRQSWPKQITPRIQAVSPDDSYGIVVAGVDHVEDPVTSLWIGEEDVDDDEEG